MPGQYISSRIMPFHFSDPHKVEAAVYSEVEDAVPFNLDDMIVDHQILGTMNEKTIVTIEGLAKDDALHPVQEAFVEEGAVQCGYCTGGMILAAVALLEENANPTDRQIAEGMNGNICRCNGYPKIAAAVRRAAEKIRR